MKTIQQRGLLAEIPVKNIPIKSAPKKRNLKSRHAVATFLHLGAGVQSSTIAEMIVEGALPRVDAVVFADTGNEPSWVYRQVDYLKLRLESANIPLIVCKKANSAGITQDVMLASTRFASMPLYSLNPKTGKKAILRRQCTNEYKIQPNDSFILDYLMDRDFAKRSSAGARLVNADVKVINLFGISADEQHRRHSETLHGKAWKEASYPLIDLNMGRKDCITWLLKHSLPVPKKSSCIVCPYHDDLYWLDLYENAQEEFWQACDFDSWLRTKEAKLYGNFRVIRDELYLHSSCKPLRSIDFKILIEAKKSKQLDMFKVEIIDGKVCATDGGFSCFS